MYNYSRLYQVWMAYEKGVIENHYKSLPDITTINFGLLSSEVSTIVLGSIINNINTYKYLGRMDFDSQLFICLSNSCPRIC